MVGVLSLQAGLHAGGHRLHLSTARRHLVCPRPPFSPPRPRHPAPALAHRAQADRGVGRVCQEELCAQPAESSTAQETAGTGKHPVWRPLAPGLAGKVEEPCEDALHDAPPSAGGDHTSIDFGTGIPEHWIHRHMCQVPRTGLQHPKGEQAHVWSLERPSLQIPQATHIHSAGAVPAAAAGGDARSSTSGAPPASRSPPRRCGTVFCSSTRA